MLSARVTLSLDCLRCYFADDHGQSHRLIYGSDHGNWQSGWIYLLLVWVYRFAS